MHFTADDKPMAPAAASLVRRPPRGRRLIAVDIENMAGGAIRSIAQAAGVRNSVQATVQLRQGEQVVVGTSHIGLLSTGLGWPGSRLVVRSGVDGADLALLEVLAHENIAGRFGELVLASGDGIFANVVGRLGAAGMDVTVVARPGTCSKRLRMAASRCVDLDAQAMSFGGAA